MGWHWAATLFDGNHPITSLGKSGLESHCLGISSSGVELGLSNQDKEVFTLPFDNNLVARMSCNRIDGTAKILCITNRPYGAGALQSCLPLHLLTVDRVNSSLHLFRAKNLWACLNFSVYEQLVLFYCAFAALRNKGPFTASTKRDQDRYDMKGEVQKFGGQIIDDGFEHALRVFRDIDSKAIRLQASVLRGELKHTPVWTAFISDHLRRSSSWLKRGSNPKVVRLGSLDHYVFCAEYKPKIGTRGEFDLKFRSEQGVYSPL
jgi:hypothetical protein